MAFTINIPGIIRLVAVKTPDEVLAVNDAGMVARSLSGRGGLVNRSTAAKLAVFRTPDGDIWPAFRDRLDPRVDPDPRRLEHPGPVPRSHAAALRAARHARSGLDSLAGETLTAEHVGGAALRSGGARIHTTGEAARSH